MADDPKWQSAGGDAPEAVQQPFSTLEVVPNYDNGKILGKYGEGMVSNGPHAPHVPHGYYQPVDQVQGSCQSPTTAAVYPAAELESKPARRPWWSWKRTWAIMIVALLAGIGIILGCVLGLRQSNSASSSPSSSSSSSPSGSSTTSTAATVPTGRSACIDTVCPQVLSSVLDSSSQGASASSPVLRVFARASDGSIKEASSLPGGAAFASTSTSSSSAWVSRGGPIKGAPAAISWRLDGKQTVTVFGLSSASAVIYKNIDLATDVQSEFRPLGAPNVASTPSLCSVGSDRIDAWSQGAVGPTGTTTLHNFYVSTQGGGYVYENSLTDKQTTAQPAVLCRSGNIQHDVVVFGNETGPGAAAWHRQWMVDTGTWSGWVSRGGSFAAGSHPVLLEVGVNRVDFLGLGSNSKLYHWSWSESGMYTDMEDAGGSLASVPAAMVSGAANDRLDVVAVGKGGDGRLVHRSLVGSTWSAAGWEDLGVVSSTAPLLVRVNSTDAGLFITAVDGSIWHAHISQANWANLTWSLIPGF